MDEVPVRRNYLVLVRLRGNAVFHERNIQQLKAALPAGARAVVFDELVVGIAAQSELLPNEILDRYFKQLRWFESVGVYELGSLSASTDGWLDPFQDWMEMRARRGARGETDDAEDMLKAKWGQVRRERPKHTRVADTLRKVFPSGR